jgi:type I protein arginine methyltransferase
MYNILSYGSMVSDSVRMNAYADALRKVVTPDSVVLDIGTGFGFFAVLACQLGARRVIAIEPDNVIEIARKVAAANQCADKIQFIHDFSLNVSLDEPADVIISDLRGVLPWFQKHLPAILDARKRLLAPGGKLIPARDMVWAALVESAELYSPYLNPWCSKPQGIDLGAARQFAVNLWKKGRGVLGSQLLGEPRLWASLDYVSVEDLNVSSRVAWTMGKAGTAHGILIWFDTVLCEGIGFSNDPTEPELIYGNAFLPFAAPTELSAEDVVTVDLRATLVGEDYVWTWKTMVSSGNPARARSEFNQSTFLGCPLSREQVATRSENYVASLGEDGIIDRTVLDLMDGKRTVAQISEQLRERFPAKFSTVRDALAKVGELSARYSRTSRPSASES